MAPNGSGSGGWSDGAGDLSWKRFLDGGSQGVSEAAVLDEGRRVKLSWVDGHESEYSLIWLRDNSDGSFHAITRQREVGYLLYTRAYNVSHTSQTAEGGTKPRTNGRRIIRADIVNNVFANRTDPRKCALFAASRRLRRNGLCISSM